MAPIVQMWVAPSPRATVQKRETLKRRMAMSGEPTTSEAYSSQIGSP